MEDKLYYLAAPLSPEEGETIVWNLEQAKKYRREMNMRGIHVIAPWIGLCESLDDTVAGERLHGMKTSANTLRRCDGIILCGPRISSGMQAELDLAKALGLHVLNYVGE